MVQVNASNKNLEISKQVKGVLSKSVRFEILNLIAEFKTPSDISRHLKENHGIENQYSNIYHNYFKNSKYLKLIDALRSKFLESYISIPNAQKKIRILKLNKIIEIYYKDFINNKSQNSFDNVLKALKSMQSETEVSNSFASGQGTVLSQNNTYLLTNIQINNKSTEEIMEDLNRRLTSQHKKL